MNGLFDDFDTVTTLVSLGGAAVVMLLFLGIASSLNTERKRIMRRLERTQKGPAISTAASTITVRIDGADSSIRGFDKLIKRIMPNPEKLRDRLARTGKRISLGEYVLVSALLVVLAYIVLSVIVGLPGLVGALFGVAIGFGLPHLVIIFLAARRLKQFTNLFPEAIELIVRGLKSGLPVTESIKSVGTEMADPVGVEFRRIADSFSFGLTLDQALWTAATRLDTPEFRFFIISLSVQQETGGNLAETLENLANILRRRKQMKKKIRAMSAEARASAMIIGSLPFIMFGALMAINPDYALVLVDDPRGRLVLLMAASSLLTGLGIMFKMARFEI
jgi:tight adherence protein B